MVLDVLADRPHSGAAAVASLVTAKQDQTTVEDVNDAVSDGRARDLMIETYRYLVSLPSAHAAYRTLLSSLADGTGAVGHPLHRGQGPHGLGHRPAAEPGRGVDRRRHGRLPAEQRRTWRPPTGRCSTRSPTRAGTPSRWPHMILVRPEYLEAALTLMRRVHGDLDGYLPRGLS